MVHNNVWGCISTSRYLQRPWSADQLLICYFSISYYYLFSVHRDAPTGIIRTIPLHSELPLTWLVTLFLVHKLYTYSDEYVPCWQILTYRYQVRTYPKLGTLCHGLWDPLAPPNLAFAFYAVLFGFARSPSLKSKFAFLNQSRNSLTMFHVLWEQTIVRLFHYWCSSMISPFYRGEKCNHFASIDLSKIKKT